MAIRYIPYFPETIEGQAVLNNFKRILKYKGNDDISESLKRGMPLYEMKEVEIVGENSDNLVIRGECISACAYLKSKGIKVDLVYIDPPFASGADYAKQVYIRKNPKMANILSDACEQLDFEELKAFEEKMYGDIWDKEKYLNWMYQNLLAIKSIMSEHAAIYVHLDWHIVHYVKIMMDEIFGEESFRNDIIWQRTYSSKKQTDGFGKVHDTILFYCKQHDLIWNQQYFAANIDSEEAYNKIDEDGRRYKSVSLTQQGQGPARMFGDRLIEPTPGMHWIWSQENIDKAMAENRIVFTKNGYPRKKQFLDEWDGKGSPLHDIWTDNEVKAINSWHGEDTGYNTQKPEALLKRIIESSSNEGMIVADFFGGSGVAAKVANDLGRQFIHCDIGINSIQTTRDRLVANNASFKVMEINDGVTLYRNPVQTMEKIKSIIPGLATATNLSKFWSGCILDTKLGEIPVYLPDLVDTNPKIIDKVFMNRLLYEALPDLPDSIKKVIIYYVDMIDEKEINTIIKKENYTLVNIEFKDLKDMLDDIVVSDYIEYKQSISNETIFETYNLKIEKFISDRVNRKIDDFNHTAFLNSSEKNPYNPILISDEGLELIEYISLDCTNSEGIWHSDEEIKIDKLGYVIHNGVKTKKFWNGSIQADKKPLRLKIRNICGDESIINI